MPQLGRRFCGVTSGAILFAWATSIGRHAHVSTPCVQRHIIMGLIKKAVQEQKAPHTLANAKKTPLENNAYIYFAPELKIKHSM